MTMKLTIAVVKGILSMKADAKAEIQIIKIIATANRERSSTSCESKEMA